MSIRILKEIGVAYRHGETPATQHLGTVTPKFLPFFVVA